MNASTLRHSALAGLAPLGGILPTMVFFEPKAHFITWMCEHFRNDYIIEVGAGTGRTARELALAGLGVTAIDLHYREAMDYPVRLFDATIFPYSPHDVVLICRPSHGHFVEGTIDQAVVRRVKAILYVGKPRNVADDLGPYHQHFRRQITNAGHEKESVYLWRLPSKSYI